MIGFSSVYSSSEEFRNVNVPDEFESLDVLAFNTTSLLSLNETGGSVNGAFYEVITEFGGHDISLWYSRANNSYGYHFIWINHLGVRLLWLFPLHNMNWKDSSGHEVTANIIWDEYGINASIIDANLNDNGISKFTVYCQDFSFTLYLAYDNDVYDNCVEAWDHHDLHMLLNIDFDQQATGTNAMDLIIQLMFFQLPNTNFYVNALIAIPIWVSTSIIIAFVILEIVKALPFT